MDVYIDDIKVQAEKDDNLLSVALRNGIYIPNLCFIEERERPFGGCRLCYVEIEGESEPVLACATKVKEGMRINTRGEKAKKLQKIAFELLLSNHRLECSKCGKRMVCELQKISKHLRVSLRSKRLKKLEPDHRIDNTHKLFLFDGGKCVLCGKCVFFCEEKKGLGVVGFVERGIKRRISTFMDKPFGELCNECIECVNICPTGAFSFKERREGLW